LEIDLAKMFDVVFGAAWTILPPASWCWPLPAKAIERISPWARSPSQVDRRVLHRELRAEVAVDPLDGRVALGDRALGHEVEDVVRPVLHGRVADAAPGLANSSTTAECSESDEYVGAVQPST
jgi:hypothetical protein